MSSIIAAATDEGNAVPPILSIPFELLIKICEAIIEIPNDGPWSYPTMAPIVGLQDLAHLTRVCKALRSAARPVLFRHFDITWLREFERPNHERYFEDLGPTYTETARFFRCLNYMRENGSAGLVRYLDADAFSDQLEICEWNMSYHYRGQPTMGGDSELIDDLFWKIAKIQITERDCVDMDTLRGDAALTTGKSVLLALLLSTFRNVRAARLPIDSGTADLLDPNNEEFCIEDKYNHTWDDRSRKCFFERLFFRWTGLARSLKSPASPDSPHPTELGEPGGLSPSPAFPYLTELELVRGLEQFGDNRPDSSLTTRHLTYLVHNAPKLKTLRLYHFDSIKVEPALDLGRITTVVLKSCDVNYRDVHRLATACNQLKTFKISSSDTIIWDRPPIWEGEDGFAETYFGHHIDDMNDREESALERDHAFPHLPWSSNLVSSSLVLQALSPASQTLENIIIGRCGRVLVDITKGLNSKRRRMDFAKFEHVQDLGIWYDNLFLDNKSNHDVFSEIVRDAGRLRCLSIFMRKKWAAEAEGEYVLDRALAQLASDLDSGKVKTYLKVIRIVKVEDIYPGETTVVPASYVDSDLESFSFEHGFEPTVDDEEVEEEVDDSQDSAPTGTEQEDHQAGEESGDVEPDRLVAFGGALPVPAQSAAGRLLQHGIYLIEICAKRDDGSGDGVYGRTFPNRAQEDYFLWDDYC
ncbi:hypothetical protein V8F20_008562 [Naviculisporaceae sp. PSN 640]